MPRLDRAPVEDAEGRKKLAGYMLRAPMSLQKMTYDAATGTVIYRSKMRVGLKRNFQLMPVAEWLALLAMQRSPPSMGPKAWPVHASLPLTYHPVPDIA